VRDAPSVGFDERNGACRCYLPYLNSAVVIKARHPLPTGGVANLCNAFLRAAKEPVKASCRLILNGIDQSGLCCC